MSEAMHRVGDGWGDNSAPRTDTDDDDRRQNYEYEGRQFILQAKDPFGFWFVKMPTGGAPPEYLSGSYTGLWECQKDIKQWCSQNPISPAKREAVETGTTPPKLVTKKRIPKKKVQEDAPTRQSTAEEEAPSEVSLFKAEEVS